MLSRGPTQDARFCTMCLYVYDELRMRHIRSWNPASTSKAAYVQAHG